VFFEREEIDALERLAISFGLSIALVPLIIFILNKYFGIKITAFNSLLIIIILCITGILLASGKRRIEWTRLRGLLRS